MFQYGYKSAGGTRHVPAGWDWWIGLVGNSRYYNYTLSINGTGRHFSDQYLTNVIVSTVAIWKNHIYIFYQVPSYTPGLHVLIQPNCYCHWISWANQKVNTAATVWAYCEIRGDIGVRIRKAEEETIATCVSKDF